MPFSTYWRMIAEFYRLTGVPMVFMMVTTLWSLVLLLEKAWTRFAGGNRIDGPSVVALVLFVLALALVVEATRALRPYPKDARTDG